VWNMFTIMKRSNEYGPTIVEENEEIMLTLEQFAKNDGVTRFSTQESNIKDILSGEVVTEREKSNSLKEVGGSNSIKRRYGLFGEMLLCILWNDSLITGIGVKNPIVDAKVRLELGVG
jgi:hypothetical protein